VNNGFCVEQQIRSEADFEEIVGQSSALRHVLQLVETVAPTDSTVLLLGETGTWKYLKRPAGESGEAAPALMSLAWSSVAAPAMAPLQDLLNLGREARMNVPGRAEGNWRCTEDMLSAPGFQWLRNLTKTTTRWGGLQGEPTDRMMEAVS
jgi:4-alpha-glucanotransferase